MLSSIAVFLAAFIGFYLFHGLGVTLGYHRLLSHRAFKVPRWLEYFIVAGGYLALEGSPIFWVATHRLHHRYSDHLGDPHSPKDGFFHAFIGWMFQPTVVITEEESRAVCPDLYRDRLYTALHLRHSGWHAALCLLICVVARVVLYVVAGPLILAANLTAMLLAFLAPLLVNTFCHLQGFGYRNFDTNEGSRNVPWVALMALGEGWHNNHHAIPQSARHGMLKEEFDISWAALSVLEKLGLARDLRSPKAKHLAELQPEMAEADIAPDMEPMVK